MDEVEAAGTDDAFREAREIETIQKAMNGGNNSEYWTSPALQARYGELLAKRMNRSNDGGSATRPPNASQIEAAKKEIWATTRAGSKERADALAALAAGGLPDLRSHDTTARDLGLDAGDVRVMQKGWDFVRGSAENAIDANQLGDDFDALSQSAQRAALQALAQPKFSKDIADALPVKVQVELRDFYEGLPQSIRQAIQAATFGAR